MRRRLALALVLSVFLPQPSARAGDGGLLVDFCAGENCLDAELAIVFENGTSTYDGPTDPGTEFPIQVVLDTRDGDIQGFSYAVAHDPRVLEIVPSALTTRGTVADPESPGSFAVPPMFDVTRTLEGGFLAGVVLSFLEPAVLPAGRHTLASAAYRFVGAPEPCSVIRVVHDRLGGPVVSINLSVSGQTGFPSHLRQGLIGASDCRETCDDLFDNDGDGAVDCDDPDCAALCEAGLPSGSCYDGVDNDGNGLADCEDPQCATSCRDPEICDDGIDNNDDGAIDCDDELCRFGFNCIDFEVCRDGVDNDQDGLVDCEDPECDDAPGGCGVELCDDGVDNDRNGLVDCDDAPCRFEAPCHVVEECDDGADNDGDGLIDCDDPRCRFQAPCRPVELCDDGIDNDQDGLLDCEEPECRGVAHCPDSEVCDDRIDNDDNGLIDCDDPECRSRAPCDAAEICTDGVDNDGDGAIDCDDSECSRMGVCVEPEVCDDGIDNDRDGLVDCDDPHCRFLAPCRTVEICADGVDNNGDGLTDCDDPQCSRTAPCVEPEICDDGIDNDGDGAVDCDDRDCSRRAPCFVPEDCGDGVDNDGDGRVDCDDPQCWRVPHCIEPEVCDDGIDNDRDLAVDCQDRDCPEVASCPSPPTPVLPGGGQQGGVCVGVCAGASLEVAFPNRSGAFPPPSRGTEIDVRFVSHVIAEGIRGWSFVARHDPAKLRLVESSLTVRGTVLDHRDPHGLGATPDMLELESMADGFVAVVEYSADSGVQLGRGFRHVIARARYRVLDNLNGSAIDIVDGPVDTIHGVVEPGFLIGDSIRAPQWVSDGHFQLTGGTVGESCSNGIDDNRNGLIDCEELSCEEIGPCLERRPFTRGDADGNGRIEVTDAVHAVMILFTGLEQTYDCPAALDADADGKTDIADPLALLHWLFRSGPALEHPFPGCGRDEGVCREASRGCSF